MSCCLWKIQKGGVKAGFSTVLLGVRNTYLGVMCCRGDPRSDHADHAAVILKLSKTCLKVSTSLSE